MLVKFSAARILEPTGLSAMTRLAENRYRRGARSRPRIRPPVPPASQYAEVKAPCRAERSSTSIFGSNDTQ